VFIPLVVDFWLLIILILIPGFFSGYLDAGIQAILLEVWGPEKSRPLIQSFHFMYTIGAFLAPLIIAPFLEKANAGGSVEASCPGIILNKFEKINICVTFETETESFNNFSLIIYV
jgi:MFS family permease